MKEIVKNGSWKLVCAFVLCAVIAISFVTCGDDDDCAECTNKVTNETKNYCGDELIEARLNPALTCK